MLCGSLDRFLATILGNISSPPHSYLKTKKLQKQNDTDIRGVLWHPLMCLAVIGARDDHELTNFRALFSVRPFK